MFKNKARDIERKVKAIEKNVTEAWEKYQNPKPLPFPIPLGGAPFSVHIHFG